MLFNGEHIGDGSPRRPTSRSTRSRARRSRPRACRARCRSSRSARAGRCSTPAPASTWRSSPAARTSPTCSTSTGRCPTLLRDVAARRDVDVRDIMVVVLDRPRHAEGIAAIRDAGARVRLISDGDVSAALLAVSDRSPVTLLWGIGGTPEGVISAAAIKSIGGGLVGRLWPRDDDERRAALDAGYDLDRQLRQDDLVRGDDCFFSATGVTDGDVLQGVRYRGGATATTESIVMRSRTGTVRRITATHNRAKLRVVRGRALRLGRRRPEHLAPVRRAEVERRAGRDDAGRVEPAVRHVVVALDRGRSRPWPRCPAAGRGRAGSPTGGVVGDPPDVALEVRRRRRRRSARASTNSRQSASVIASPSEVAAASRRRSSSQSSAAEERPRTPPRRPAGVRGEAGAVDAVVDVGVHALVDRVDLVAQVRSG